MSSTPREIGTLIVVVLKANHLPNKRNIGKQDPYCVVTVNGEKRRTKAIKRGGQHPEWDEEVRFTLFEDTDDILARTANNDGSPPPLPPKDNSALKKIKGGKVLKLACYADDAREPDLIGVADVDLTEVLTKGETDEWFILMNKDKFAGKVYLELTFWSNEPAPEKKVAPKPTKANKQYGGPGSFVPSRDKPSHPPRAVSFSGSYGPQPDLYVAPYEQHPQAPMDDLAQEFGEFGISRRRESFPPVPPVAYPHHPQASYHINDGSGGYGYDPPAQSSGFYGPYGAQPGYPALSDAQPSLQYQSAIRGPRHSIPTASSGFMPLVQQSAFSPVQTDPYSPIPHTTGPIGYSNPPPQQYITTPAYPPQQNGLPLQGDPYQPASASGPMYQGAYTYPQYAVPASISAPQQHYTPVTAQGGSPAGVPYQAYPPPPAHPDTLPPPNPLPSANLPSGVTVGGSRPLPPQPIVYSQPIPQQLDSPQRVSKYSPSLQPGDVSPGPPMQSSHPLPVPPPPPPIQFSAEPQAFNSNGTRAIAPPPPPPPQLVNGSSRRQSGLPQPPIAYHQQSSYQPPPPPPPPPLNLGQPTEYAYNQLPVPPPPPPPILHSNGINQNPYQAGPPLPPPPNLPAVGDQGHWGAYNNSQ